MTKERARPQVGRGGGRCAVDVLGACRWATMVCLLVLAGMSSSVRAAAAIDPATGVFGLKWGASKAEVVKLYPPRATLGAEMPNASVFTGSLNFGAVTLSNASAIFQLAPRGQLSAVTLVADADTAPVVLAAVQTALGVPRHASTVRGGKYRQHVFEWSTPRYGVRLRFVTAATDVDGRQAASGELELEVQQAPLGRSEVDAVQDAVVAQAQYERQDAARALAARNAREQANADESLAAQQGRTAQQLAQCQLRGLVLPKEFVVLAAGGYQGIEQTFQLDDSGTAAGLFEVEVNFTAKPVVLMLGAYNPSVWRLRWTKGTKLVAVVLGGYHRQEIVGLPNGVPLLTTTYANKGACGYFYAASDGDRFINPLARRLFGRPAEMIYPANRGRILIGDPIPAGATLVSAPGPGIDAFVDPTRPLAGGAGIAAAVQRGVLRPSTRVDIDAWGVVWAAQRPPSDVPPTAGAGGLRMPSPNRDNSYVILAPFEMPAGLHGGHSVDFIVSKGVPYPTGNPGHSRVFDLNTGRCAGVNCSSY